MIKIDKSKSMKCKLCEKEIEKYDARFNQLVLDEKHAANICLGCVDKFNKWHGKNLAVLFPTKSLKLRFGQKKE